MMLNCRSRAKTQFYHQLGKLLSGFQTANTKVPFPFWTVHLFLYKFLFPNPSDFKMTHFHLIKFPPVTTTNYSWLIPSEWSSSHLLINLPMNNIKSHILNFLAFSSFYSLFLVLTETILKPGVLIFVSF